MTTHGQQLLPPPAVRASAACAAAAAECSAWVSAVQGCCLLHVLQGRDAAGCCALLHCCSRNSCSNAGLLLVCCCSCHSLSEAAAVPCRQARPGFACSRCLGGCDSSNTLAAAAARQHAAFSPRSLLAGCLLLLARILVNLHVRDGRQCTHVRHRCQWYARCCAWVFGLALRTPVQPGLQLPCWLVRQVTNAGADASQSPECAQFTPYS